MEIFLGFWLVSGILAAVIWSRKGGSVGAGFLIGLLLGGVGVIIVLVATPRRRRSASG